MEQKKNHKQVNRLNTDAEQRWALQRRALYRDLHEHAKKLVQAHPHQFPELEKILHALQALEMAALEDDGGYRKVPVDARRNLPDYVQRLEEAIAITGVKPMLEDWACVRFDLQELARLRSLDAEA